MRLRLISLTSASLFTLLSLVPLGCDQKIDGESASEGTSDSDTDGETAGTSGASDTSGGSSDGTTGDATTGMTSGGSSGSSSSSDSSGSEATTDDSSGSDSDTTTTGDSDSESGDPPTGCVGEAQPIEGLVTAMAHLKSDEPPDMTSGGSSGSSSGGELDPSTMIISLSDQAFSCKDPNGNLDCGPQWRVRIVLPPEYQTPGIYKVGIGDVIGIFTETGEDEGGNECGFGGGTWEATLEILEIDDTTVAGRLCDTDDLWFWTKPELNGLFYADRC